ncbi:SDR family oxidoreductase [Lachnospiraceae bacterium OttesenSCG-928-E19]|nr:SDR family oxidoreductase [Lachnospiraceae bacterium OttesenSCG-928-E19]
MKLQGKTAIVTGAGKGIGREIALGLASEGALVVLVSRTKSDLDKVAEEITQAGGKSISIPKDLTDSEQVQALVDEVVKNYGGIDILVNNAGGYPKEIYNFSEQSPLKIWDWKEEQWDQIIKTNLKIPFLCTNKVLPVMIKQQKGDIVNISSRMGRIASQMGAYAVAKAGIITLTKTSAIQALEHGIKVNAVSPSILDTPGQREYNKSVGQDGVPMGNAADVAKAVLYLVCDSPSNMSGQSLDLFTTL